MSVQAEALKKGKMVVKNRFSTSMFYKQKPCFIGIWILGGGTFRLFVGCWWITILPGWCNCIVCGIIACCWIIAWGCDCVTCTCDGWCIAVTMVGVLCAIWFCCIIDVVTVLICSIFGCICGGGTANIGGGTDICGMIACWLEINWKTLPKSVSFQEKKHVDLVSYLWMRLLNGVHRLYGLLGKLNRWHWWVHLLKMYNFLLKSFD